ncbi:hypothetical protein ncot_13175 [Nocardioides sp. JQ2195]|uniref:choice-of-anchor P family protein n=1 Tax=Nocardioides sp. JQ2195 TaxID=2592334 RepID=UPI00143E8EF0|nr:choice-of-anchor P family protein [Nocardioides sp. JQ2195]QIX27452.1 hypothetical protein ncot_13175 [Nocardioides sp. JQ2195]
MKTSVRRFLAASTVAAMAAAGTLSITAGADAQSAQAAKRTTDYVFNGYAYGTKATTGLVGVTSSPTANSTVGCTRNTGKRDHKSIADTNVAGVLKVGTITSNTSSYRKNGRVGTLSTNQVAAVTLGDPNGIRIEITGLSTKANAFAGKSGKLHAKATFDALKINAKTGTVLDDILDGVANPLNVLLKEIQKNGGSLPIPGLGVLNLGDKTENVTKKHARARATSLRVKLYGPDAAPGGGDDISVRIGRANARIAKGVTSGVMTGKGQAIKASLLDGTVKLGPLGNKVLKCEGTDGKVLKNSTAGVDLLNANLLKVGAVEALTYGKQRSRNRATAWTMGRVANLSLKAGDTGIEVSGVVGRANVKRRANGKLVKSIKGSKVAEILIGGEKIALPAPGKAVEIPGVVKISFMVKKKSKTSIEVTALRLDLLDGSLGTLNLGFAKARIRKS